MGRNRILRAKDFFASGRSDKRVMRGKIRGWALFILWIFPLISSGQAEEIKYESGARRDPFIPLITAEGNLLAAKGKQTGDFKVEGIIFDPREGSYALINGKFYKQGDHIDNANVITIFRDRVVLSVNDQEKVLWLREELAKK